MTNKSTKIVVYSVISIVLFTLLFYFYPADIFEANIINDASSIDIDIALRGFFDNTRLPENINAENVAKVTPTIKGTMLLIICLVGLPIMIGYRVATNNPYKKEKTNTESTQNTESKN